MRSYGGAAEGESSCYSNEPRPLFGMRRLIGPRSLTTSFSPPGPLRVLGKVAAAGPGSRDNRVARSGQGVELRVEGRRYFSESSVFPIRIHALSRPSASVSPSVSLDTAAPRVQRGPPVALCSLGLNTRRCPAGWGRVWCGPLTLMGRGWPDSSRMEHRLPLWG